jgi:hypothetical protein
VFFLTLFLAIANTFVYLPSNFLPSSFYQKTEKPVPKPRVLTEDPDKKKLRSDSAAPQLITFPAREPVPQAPAVEAYGNLPMSFEANHGQTEAEIKFLSRGPGYSLSLSSTQATFNLTKPSRKKLRNKALPSPEILAQESTTQTSVVSMTMLHSNRAPRVEGLDQLAGSSNYLIGNDPERWQINVPNYGRVKYTDVYPGVDLIYYGNQRQLEYDFVVAPGASHRSIRLAFRGVQNTRIDGRGDLVLGVAGGEIRQRKPVVYQETGGVKEYVEGRYLLTGRHEVAFEIAQYDASKPLVIDPILVYSSLLGGSGGDFGHAIAVDDFGNVYLAGETTSINFPIRNPFKSEIRGNANPFITKINAAGSEILYSTYLGGSAHDRAEAIAVDSTGHVYLTGTTSSTDFPTLNPVQPGLSTQFPSGGVDVFITKLNASGSGLMFSTYLGGSGFDMGHGIAVDSSGNTYVTGVAMQGLPTTTQTFQLNFNGHFDAFIAKLNPSGTQILYSTYLGGRDNDIGGAITVDASENAYITGYTESSFDFPVRNALQQQFGGGISDAFVAKIPTVTAPFVFPLDSFDDENGGVPAPSYSNFSNWNVTAGQVNLQSSPNSNDNLIVNLDVAPPQGATIETKSPLTLSPGTYRLRFDLAIQTVTDTVTVRIGNVFSETLTMNALVSSGLFATVVRDIPIPTQMSAKLSFEFAGGQGIGIYLDNVSFFERNGQEYVTFLGGSADEDARTSFNSGIEVDLAGNAYVTGITASIDFPMVNATQPTLAGSKDAFVSKLNPSGSALVYSTYLGGSSDDAGNDMAIDPDGNAYVVGNTMSTNFPVKNAIQPTFGGDIQIGGDAFITKFNATGDGIVYSTYLGGGGTDVAEGVTVDSGGNAFVTGYTRSANFPLANALQATRGDDQWDAFFLKIPLVAGTGLPDVFQVSPNVAGNTGIVTFEIRGENFIGLSASVKIVKPGTNELHALRTTVKGAAIILAPFDLTGAATGPWDMTVEFSNGHSEHLPKAITIVAGGQPRIWIDLIGPRVVRGGRRQIYHVVVGNSGEVDAFQVPVWVKTQKDQAGKIRVPLEHPPDPTPSPIDWTTVPQTLETETDSTTPILIPYLPANSTRAIPVEVSAELRPFSVEVWANRPLLSHLSSQNLDPAFDCLNDLTRFLIEEAIDKALPVDCLEQLGRFGRQQLLDFSLKAVTGTDDPGYISHIQFVYGLVSVAVACLREVPVLKPIDIAFDIIENSAKGIALGATLSECISAFLAIVTPSHPDTINVVESFDPNDKVGPVGVGPPGHVHFENKATATAPAQEVVVTDQLDANLLDLNSFRFGPISFGDRRVMPIGSTNFTTDVDLRPGKSLIVRISGKLDTSSGLLTWNFVSLHPATGLPPTDPLAGFLPPNANPPEGDGNVLFTVSPKKDLPTGTVINNSASIVFDENPAIHTRTWSNTIDNSTPASHVHPLPATHSSASINVQWSAADTGSGIRDYTIYVSDNLGPFTPWLTHTTSTQATFITTANHTYSFFSVARDMAGNTEVVKTTAEATTRIISIAGIAGRVTGSGGNALSHVTMTLSGSRTATASTDANGDYSFADLPAGSYTVTPSKTNYTFNPTNLVFNDLSANQTANFAATITPGVPILISEETSTRAIAIDSVLWLRDPFQINSPVPWGLDGRTRIMLFAMNLEFQPGENISLVSADAEDASHHVHPLIVEYVGTVPGFTWLSCVVVRLDDDMSGIGDVLVRIKLRGVPSNRVRLGIGHNGGGPPDDIGAAPTPGRQP